SQPPSPNHGILISPKNPSTTDEVTLDEPRLIAVYDSFDGTELRTPERYLRDYDLKPKKNSENINVLERRNMTFRGASALYARFRTSSTQGSTSETEELIVYKAPKGIGPTFYVVSLRTNPEFYDRDHMLYLQIQQGLTFTDVPHGECS